MIWSKHVRGFVFLSLKMKKSGRKEGMGHTDQLRKKHCCSLIVDRLQHPSDASEYPRWVVSIYGIIKKAHELTNWYKVFNSQLYGSI